MLGELEDADELDGGFVEGDEPEGKDLVDGDVENASSLVKH